MAEPLTYESNALPAARGRTVRWVMLAGLLFFGVQLWLLSDFWLYRPLPRVLIYLGAIVACLLPPVQWAIGWLDAALRPRSLARTAAIVTVIVIVSIAALYATARSSDRQFTPIMHDEYAYLLQAQIFASGHLWMPHHPLADFFDTFYVIVDRVYVSQYFPGAPLMFVPGVWLGLDEWMMPLLIAGLCCGALFLLIRELFGGATGLASVVVLIGVLGFRFVSITPLSQTPALLLATVALFAILRWDRGRLRAWMIAAGVALGWLAVTRPLEGVVCGGLCGVFVAVRLAREPFAVWRKTLLAGLLPLVPFLALQLVINHGVTGRWLQTPFDYYLNRDMPGTELGFHPFDASARPMSPLPQKQAFFDSQVVTAARSHTVAQVFHDWTGRRFYNATTEIFPDMLLVMVVPAGLLALRDLRRLLALGIMPVWCVAYSLHAFTFAHYYVFYAPSVCVAIFAGFDGIALSLGGRGARAARSAQFLLPVVISVLAMPQTKRDIRDQLFRNPVERAIEEAVATIPEPRAIVLVRYSANAVAESEVVYNADVAWPDDARAIRAHDLGDDRNVALYRYYAQRQPDRVVYRFDRADNTLHRLGAVTTLADLTPATTSAVTRPSIR